MTLLIKKLIFKIIFNFSFFLILMIGIQNSSNRKQINFISTENGGLLYVDYPKNPETLEYDQTGKIEVEYNSSGAIGSVEKIIVINANTASGQIRLKIKGFVEGS